MKKCCRELGGGGGDLPKNINSRAKCNVEFENPFVTEGGSLIYDKSCVPMLRNGIHASSFRDGRVGSYRPGPLVIILDYEGHSKHKRVRAYACL